MIDHNPGLVTDGHHVRRRLPHHLDFGYPRSCLVSVLLEQGSRFFVVSPCQGFVVEPSLRKHLDRHWYGLDLPHISFGSFPTVVYFPGSIQFSILAGRILFKDLRYHTSNQTIRLVKGQLSWRYWIRKPTEEDELRHARVGAEDVGRESGLSSVQMRR